MHAGEDHSATNRSTGLAAAAPWPDPERTTLWGRSRHAGPRSVGPPLLDLHCPQQANPQTECGHMLIGAGQGMQLMAHGDGVSTADTPTPTLPMQAAPASLHAGVMPHVAGPPWRTQLPPAWTVVAAGGSSGWLLQGSGRPPQYKRGDPGQPEAETRTSSRDVMGGVPSCRR